MPVLTTRRLTLRPLQRSDAGAIHRFMSDAEVMRYWSTPPHSDEAITVRWVDESVAAMHAGTGLEYVVADREQLVGRIGVFNADNIGYFFGRPYWGCGYATEALHAFIGFAFEHRAIAELHADIDPRNIASLRLLERLGFKQTGFAERTVEVNGEWCDSVYLKLCAPFA